MGLFGVMSYVWSWVHLLLRPMCMVFRHFSRVVHLVLHRKVDVVWVYHCIGSGLLWLYRKGGALEVGQASTKSVVINSVLILITDLLFTQLAMG